MKLFICLECQDVVRLIDKKRKCQCGKCWGMYEDEIFATYHGPAVPLGFNNTSLVWAINNQPVSGKGKMFEAFVIPEKCSTFRKNAPKKKGRKKSKTKKPTAQEKKGAKALKLGAMMDEASASAELTKFYSHGKSDE